MTPDPLTTAEAPAGILGCKFAPKLTGLTSSTLPPLGIVNKVWPLNDIDAPIATEPVSFTSRKTKS